MKVIYPKNLLLNLLIGLSFLGAFQTSVRAQDEEIQEVPAKVMNTFDVTFEPPNENHPKVTKAGASRGSHCALNSQESISPFTPLLPSSNFGLTVSSHPTVLAHIPTSSAEYIFFTLRDEVSEETFQTILPISPQSGIIGIDIPREAPALEVGKTYKWSFALMCNDKLRPDSPTVEGFIKRIQPEYELANKLEKFEDNDINVAALYGKAGIWYDTLSTLVNLKQNEPQDRNLKKIWDNLLLNVGLESITNAEVVD